jgi:hypothetical protein
MEEAFEDKYNPTEKSLYTPEEFAEIVITHRGNQAYWWCSWMLAKINQEAAKRDLDGIPDPVSKLISKTSKVLLKRGYHKHKRASDNLPNRMRTDEELKKLAQDVADGLVYGSWAVPEGQDPNMCFMVSLFMGAKEHLNMMAAGIVHNYEYLSEAGPRSVNGMPSFFSMKQINAPDFEKLREYCKILQDKREEAAQALEDA